MIQKAQYYTTPGKMRPQIGKQKVYKNAIKIVRNFVRVCEKHGKMKANNDTMKAFSSSSM